MIPNKKERSIIRTDSSTSVTTEHREINIFELQNIDADNINAESHLRLMVIY